MYLLLKDKWRSVLRIIKRNKCIKKEKLLLGCPSSSIIVVIIKLSRGINNANDNIIIYKIDITL